MAKREGRNARPLVVKAPAKINLCLEVLGRRPDGYHEIRTIMQAVGLYDELSFRERPDRRIVLTASGKGLPPPEQNLVFRAARLIQERFAPSRGAAIHLKKAIPIGGGLGGGSSDAAATLRALNRLWALHLDAQELQSLAAELGSDVPFFVRGGTALCEGRGERVTPLPVEATFHYVLAMPPFPTSTRAVYGALAADLTSARRKDRIGVLQSALMTGDSGRLGRGLYNDLQAAAFRVSPGLRRFGESLAGAMRRRGSCGFSLSGSGSSFLVLFGSSDEPRAEAKRLAETLDISTLAVPSLAAEVIVMS